MRIAVAAAALAMAWAGPAAAYSQAASYLMNKAVKEACGGGGGMFAEATERDLTGDGRTDLILDHSKLVCASGSPTTCGPALPPGCLVTIYVREGTLLVERRSYMGDGFAIGSGDPPTIRIVAVDGSSSRPGGAVRERSIRWNGRTFK